MPNCLYYLLSLINVLMMFFLFLTELMLLGFISLLLTVFQGLVSRICIPAYLASIMLPCKKGTVSASGSEHYSNLTTNNRRRLLSEDTNSGHCLHEVYHSPLTLTDWYTLLFYHFLDCL